MPSLGRKGIGKEDAILPEETTQMLRAALADRRASEDLLVRFIPRVRRIVALRMGRSLRQLVDEEDVVQDAIFGAWRGLETFELRSESSFLNWLATIVENELRRNARRHGARKRAVRPRRLGISDSDGSLGESLLAGGDPTPSAFAQAEELEERLEELLLGLDPEDRELVVCSRLCGMSADEIAERLGHGTASTVRSRLSRVLARIAKELAR